MKIFLVAVLIFPINAQTPIKGARDLQKYLFRNYSWKYRPALIQSQTTIVNVGLYLRDINDINENQHTLTMHGGIHLLWLDYRLRWSPSEYNNTFSINAGVWRVWRPDWTVHNGFQPMGERDTSLWTAPYTSSQVWIHFDGIVSYYTVLSKTFPCVFDYTDFPFDTQRCTMVIGSWMYDYKQVDVQWSRSRSLQWNFQWLGSATNRSRTSGWWLKDVARKKKYWYENQGDTIEDPPEIGVDPGIVWPLLHVDFILERHRPYFALLELTPLILTSLLTLLSFGIDSEIVATGVLFATLLAQGLCSWSLVRQLPLGGVGGVPKILKIYAVCFCLTSIALLLHLILQRLRTLDKRSPVVSYLGNILSKPWLRALNAVNALKITSFGTDYHEIIELTNAVEISEDKFNEKIDKAIWTLKKIFFLIFTLIYVVSFSVTLMH